MAFSAVLHGAFILPDKQKFTAPNSAEI